MQQSSSTHPYNHIKTLTNNFTPLLHLLIPATPKHLSTFFSNLFPPAMYLHMHQTFPMPLHSSCNCDKDRLLLVAQLVLNKTGHAAFGESRETERKEGARGGLYQRRRAKGSRDGVSFFISSIVEVHNSVAYYGCYSCSGRQLCPPCMRAATDSCTDTLLRFVAVQQAMQYTTLRRGASCPHCQI